MNELNINHGGYMKTAIITGASHGIGSAITKMILNDFDYIGVCARNTDGALEKLGQHPNLHCFSGDVSDYDFVQGMVDTIYQTTGSIDLLINNAGISRIGLFTDMTRDEWNEVVGINLGSVFNTCSTVVPYMVHQKQGRIINISSVWGNVGASCEVAYSATKGGINSFTKALAKELAPSNISVNAIAFGAVDTRMNSQLDTDERSALEDEIPFGRMATSLEAAQLVNNIINSPMYYTGDIIKFDGGWT
jgi:3-oxoacyl-[acyl-carrier protein] reductase